MFPRSQGRRGQRVRGDPDAERDITVGWGHRADHLRGDQRARGEVQQERFADQGLAGDLRGGQPGGTALRADPDDGEIRRGHHLPAGQRAGECHDIELGLVVGGEPDRPASAGDHE